MEDKLLDEFRKEWKEELHHKNDQAPANPAALQAGNSQAASVVKGESQPPSDGRSKSHFEDIDKGDIAPKEKEKERDSKKHVFQPFVIAEHLLSGNSAAESLTPDGGSGAKRKHELREELYVSRNKRLKLLSPESSLKQKRNDSLLDILIADLVSGLEINLTLPISS